MTLQLIVHKPTVAKENDFAPQAVGEPLYQ